MTETDVLENIEADTKKGFDLLERLKNRGLRRATLTLFLDEELGPKLGWAYDVNHPTQNYFIRREREGVVGELDALDEKYEEAKAELEASAATKAVTTKAHDAFEKEWADKREALQAEVTELTAELAKTGLTISMRAVPPVIQKNTRRQAKEKLGITEKGIPEDRTDEFNLSQLAYLMTVMFQSVTDVESGDVNTATSYDDAMALIDFLPPGQFERLNETMGRVQFTDAISRSIEGQEDFS